MLSGYLPLLAMLIVTSSLAIGMVVGSFILGPKKPNAYKETTYECGMTPVGSARERFPIRFYLIAMLFIVFDIETIFLYPWAVNFQGLPHAMKIFNFVEMAIFSAILFVGYFYILGKGALDWDESEQAKPSNVVTPELLAPRGRIKFGNEASGKVDLAKAPVGERLPGYGASSQEERIPVVSKS